MVQHHVTSTNTLHDYSHYFRLFTDLAEVNIGFPLDALRAKDNKTNEQAIILCVLC